MWCSSCQQDVPAIGQPDTGRSVCARCHSTLRPPHAVRICEDGIALDEEPPLVATAAVRPLITNDWQIRRQTRELGRKLRHEIGGSRAPMNSSRDAERPLNQPQNLFDEIRDMTAAPLVTLPGSALPHSVALARRPEGGQFAAWLFAFGGAIVLGSGLGTIGSCLSTGHTEVWNLALGLTLGGQGLLIFGLVMIVMRLWRNSRYATGKLQEVHAELGQLRRTADALTAMRTGGAPAFYAELVRGASPQTLLANLKGQLDQLATRVSGEF